MVRGNNQDNATYLIAWNAKKFDWKTIDKDIAKIGKDGFFEGRWSCGSNKRIRKGDRIYLIRLGKEPRGIIGSGWAMSNAYQDEHWDENKIRLNIKSNYIDIFYTTLFNAEKESILQRKELIDNKILKKMHWDTQSSGVKIPDDVAMELDRVWQKILAEKQVQEVSANYSNVPDEMDPFVEGEPTQITSTRYERNPAARNKCIDHYGYDCTICGFNFGHAYGSLGKDYIHVHHLTPISERGAEYTLNPIEELRPVCANCHSIIHSTRPPRTIEQVRLVFKGNKK